MNRMQQVFDAAVNRFQKGFYQSGNHYSCVLGTLVQEELITREEWREASAGILGHFGVLLKQLETLYEVWITQLLEKGILVEDSDKMLTWCELKKWSKEQQGEWYNKYLERIAEYHGLEFNLKSKNTSIHTILEVV